MFDLTKYKNLIKETNSMNEIGKVIQVIGLVIEADGPAASIGDLCHIYTDSSALPIFAEVVGFKENKILLMPLGDMEGLKPGSIVMNTQAPMQIKVGHELLGRVLDGLGNPIDANVQVKSNKFYSTNKPNINPLARKRIDEPLSLGIRSVDGFMTVGKGQRMGIFAGSGVGKSTTLAMIARNTTADLNVIALIGERGREVREFIENSLGEEGLSRSVVVVATSEQPSLVKIKAAYVATAIAEYFRDCGHDVLFMLDSMTRISMAQREVGLAVGEPPATRGYTPSVFALMPKLMERTGAGEKGTITGLYTILVEGDDFNEPISDTARSILDGHIMLSRELAHKNHYPAVDVLQSISRVMTDITTKEHKAAAGKLRNLLAVYQKNADLINIGAYIKGTDANVDKALELNEPINDFLRQGLDEKTPYDETIERIMQIAES
ncbi:MAG: flagellar protein export ATPase FliI [Candidatus Gastranaerophilales bacterium]|nr:flagellar protein export ATPase FliI [Candidatus Gastranaerophilales bacterium]